jgi:hypothetical protein
LKNRSENSAGRGQILPVLQANSRSIGQKSGEICTGQADLQPISFKSDRLLAIRLNPAKKRWASRWLSLREFHVKASPPESFASCFV